jgi:hypothetical protein
MRPDSKLKSPAGSLRMKTVITARLSIHRLLGMTTAGIAWKKIRNEHK